MLCMEQQVKLHDIRLLNMAVSMNTLRHLMSTDMNELTVLSCAML